MAAKAKPKSKARPKPQRNVKIKPKTQVKAKSKKPVKPKRTPSAKAKSHNKKAGSKARAKKTTSATQTTKRSKTTPKKAVGRKEKKLTKPRTNDQSKTAKSSPSAAVYRKQVKTAGSKPKAPRSKSGTAATIPAAQPAPGGVNKGPGRPKKEQTATRDQKDKKAKHAPVLPPQSLEKDNYGGGTENLNKEGKPLPNEIDEELDIEVEAEEDITLDALTTELDDGTDTIDVDDLTDDFDEDAFAEDLADEGDEDLDLTEDLSEELGPKTFFRETEPHVEDDEEEIPRSW